MKALRKVVFWCHLIVGVLVAAVVVIMSVTGVLLTYQKQMTLWADTRGLDGSPPTVGAPRLPVDSLLGVVQAAMGAKPTAVTVRAGDNTPVEVVMGTRRAFANAYTGAVLGEGSAPMREFFRVTTAWHRTLGATGERRALGRAITGFSNLGFLFIVVTGLYLWWPRSWTRARLRNIAAFRTHVRGKARDFNWHNTIGVWSFLPLVIVVASGVVISYPWASGLVYRAMGEQPPAAGGPPGGGAGAGGRRVEGAADGRGGAPDLSTRFSGIDAAIGAGKQKMPEWRAISVQLPPASAKTVNVSLDAGTGGQPQLRSTLTVDRATNAPTKLDDFSSQSPGRRLRSILRFAHTGEVLGVVGQTIAGLVTLGSVVLAYTGIALAIRRLWAWRRRRVRVVELKERKAA